MKFTADRDELAAAIARAAQGLPAHPVQPVHAGMLVTAETDCGRNFDGAVQLTCGDGNVLFTATMNAEVAEPGPVILPGKMLADISRYFPPGKPVTVTADTRAVISAGRAEFGLACSPGEDYPGWDAPPGVLVTAEARQFAAACRKIAPAASRTEVILGTVLLAPGEGLRLVATDRYCMGAVSVPFRDSLPPGYPPALIPVSVPERLARILAEQDGQLGLGWDDHLVAMSAPGLAVITRQVAGKFLPWEPVMAKLPETRFTADIPELVRAVKAAALAAAPLVSITLAFSPGEVAVSASSASGQAQERIPAEYAGDALSLIVSSRMLLDGLSGAGEQAQLGVTAPRAPLFICGDGLTWMIQPYRDLQEGGS